MSYYSRCFVFFLLPNKNRVFFPHINSRRNVTIEKSMKLVYNCKSDKSDVFMFWHLLSGNFALFIDVIEKFTYVQF